MTEYSTNNVIESYTFFLDENRDFCINVKSMESGDLIASIILGKEDVDDLKEFIDTVYDDIYG